LAEAILSPRSSADVQEAKVTIQDLGSLGEFVAAVATVVTLAYLALQIRRNSKTVQGASLQSLLELEVATFSLKAQYANVYRRGCANISDLDDDERVVFEQIVSSEMSLFTSGFFQYQNGLIEDSDPFDSEWKRFYLKQSGFQSVWSEISSSYPKAFCQHLDEVEKTAGGSA
jgi:hypothetical protein